MRTDRNYYEILGLTRTASTTEIKKRFRELARKYHPDVTADKVMGTKAFVAINEAYKTLVDPEKRRAYDATLIDSTQRVDFSRPTGRTTSAGPRSGGTQRQTGPVRRPASRAQVEKLIRDAELAFIRRRLNEATELCRQAIRLDRSCARAHSILGDIYRSRRHYDHAINEYGYAVQFDPSDRQSQAKLDKLIERSRPLKMTWETPDGRMSPQAVVFNVIGWTAAIFGVFLIGIAPGSPIGWLADSRAPLITGWSWNLIIILLLDGALVGFLLAVNGLVDHPDEEFIFDSGGKGWGIVPTGLLLLVFSPFFFLGAAGAYLFFGFIQDTISPSMVKAFAACAAIVILAAPMYPIDRHSVLLLGGNLAFTGIVAGWYLGAMFKPERN